MRKWCWFFNIPKKNIFFFFFKLKPNNKHKIVIDKLKKCKTSSSIDLCGNKMNCIYLFISKGWKKKITKNAIPICTGISLYLHILHISIYSSDHMPSFVIFFIWKPQSRWRRTKKKPCESPKQYKQQKEVALLQHESDEQKKTFIFIIFTIESHRHITTNIFYLFKKKTQNFTVYNNIQCTRILCTHFLTCFSFCQ